MEKVARIHPDGIVDQGLSDHESLEPVPVELTGTLHYLQSTRIMKLFSYVMDDKINMEKYDKLSQKLEKLIKARFWDQPVEGKINRQTLFASLLYHDIIPNHENEAAKDSLLKAVENGPSGHFNTGIFGTKYNWDDIEDYNHEAINIANSTDYGLASGVFTSDDQKAKWTAERIEAGVIWHNDWFVDGVNLPGGGYKKSGYGRDGGIDSLYSYGQTKRVSKRLF